MNKKKFEEMRTANQDKYTPKEWRDYYNIINKSQREGAGKTLNSKYEIVKDINKYYDNKSKQQDYILILILIFIVIFFALTIYNYLFSYCVLPCSGLNTCLN